MSLKHLVLVSAAAAAAVSVGLAQRPPDPPKGSVRLFPGIGQIPNLIPRDGLLTYEPVQLELKLTETQKKQQLAILESGRERMRQTIQKSSRAKKGRQSKERLEAREAIQRESQAALDQTLTQSQRDRLNQIELQVQNAMAFERPEIQKQLELLQSQIEEIKKIVERSRSEIMQASDVPVDMNPKDGGATPTMDDVRAFVQSPQFKEAHRTSVDRIRLAGAAMTDRVASVLSERQNREYQKMLGPPFDAASLNGPGDDVETLTARVAASLGLMGQRADPNFDVRVAKPAYNASHPKVLIDEAHHNFHTAAGRYKPFAQIVANDGYQVAPNRSNFTEQALKGCDILVIANALGAENMGDPGASDSAFTEGECDVLSKWVRNGGSLLLITDHAPMGSAAESLAKRFGVDMSKGATRDESNSADGRPASLVFSQANKLLADHPITRGRNESERIGRVQTFTGQSLKGPPGCTVLLKLADTAFDYVEGNEVSAAGRAQGLAFICGKGRVVVLGEAAMLSAQVAGNGDFKMGMNAGGIDNKQLALNIMHWLSWLLEPPAGALKKAA
jgi:hypothetical protein